MSEYFYPILLFSFAFLAGFVDSIAGGGGLIQLPAFLVFLPGLPIPAAMGSNKFASFSGTVVSTVRYTRQTEIQWKSIVPALVMAIIFSFLGARIMTELNREYMKAILLALLVLVAIYTFFKKDFGISHQPKLSGLKLLAYSLLTGIIIGFYDGFFGPGAGNFLILIFISLFGFSFLISSASAKLVNCATSISALGYFIYTGQVIYALAIPVALFNMAGSFIGSRIAIKQGSTFIRAIFLTIVCFLILKLGMDVFHIGNLSL